jgi:acyl carrier protein
VSTTTTLLHYLSEELLDPLDNLKLTEDDNILTTGLINSLGIMRLITFVEEEFRLEIPPEDVTLENFRSIRCMADYLERRIRAS